jgi:YfiH family protein
MNTDWIIPDWPAPASVHALVTTRRGGTSRGAYSSLNLGAAVGDDPEAVAENRARLCRLLPAAPIWLQQVHGTEVVCAESSTQGVIADASWSWKPRTVCAIMVADCLPVLLCDADGTTVAAAHAGWRGLCAGILERTVEALQRPPDSILAWLGPAIGPDHFEVGDDVREAFMRRDAHAVTAFRPRQPGKWMADLNGLACQRLKKIGITRIHGGGMCTYSDPDRFFSHRRDRISGRMAATVWIDAPIHS